MPHAAGIGQEAQWSGTAFSLIAIMRGRVSRIGLNYELFRRKVRLIVCVCLNGITWHATKETMNDDCTRSP